MNYVLSLLPIALYLLILRAFDSFSLARWKVLLSCIAYGLACAAVLFLFTRSVSLPALAVPVVEEILKGLAAPFMISRKKIRFHHEALIYGAAVGAGFSLLENLVYLYFQPEMLAGTAVVRGFGCAILHMGCTALAGTLLLLMEKGGIPLPAGTAVSIIPSVLIHQFYNYGQENMLADPLLLMTVAIVLFLALFMILFAYGERKIYRWMDHSLAVDIQILSAIRNGSFASTGVGRYLIDMKDQFKPECFFDMICYVQLTLELKIEKQSYMLLRQTGFGGEEMGMTYPEYVAKKAEIASLRKRIGKTGMMVLAPLVS